MKKHYVAYSLEEAETFCRKNKGFWMGETIISVLPVMTYKVWNCYY